MYLTCETAQSQENRVEWTANTEVLACSCQKGSGEVKPIIPGSIPNANKLLRHDHFSYTEVNVSQYIWEAKTYKNNW